MARTNVKVAEMLAVTDEKGPLFRAALSGEGGYPVGYGSGPLPLPLRHGLVEIGLR